MTFEQQFTRGIEYRTHFDPDFKLDEKAKAQLEATFSKTSEQALQEPFFSIRQKICSLAQIYAADNSAKPFAYQCLADSHTFLTACLQQGIVDKRYMTLTIGDVSVDGQRLYDVSRETLRSAVATSISTFEEPAFHVWLTLVDMTVIDLTIVSQLIGLQLMPAAENSEQSLTVWRPERRGRLDYHPVLIDDDFLSRLQRSAH